MSPWYITLFIAIIGALVGSSASYFYTKLLKKSDNEYKKKLILLETMSILKESLLKDVYSYWSKGNENCIDSFVNKLDTEKRHYLEHSLNSKTSEFLKLIHIYTNDYIDRKSGELLKKEINDTTFKMIAIITGGDFNSKQRKPDSSRIKDTRDSINSLYFTLIKYM